MIPGSPRHPHPSQACAAEIFVDTLAASATTMEKYRLKIGIPVSTAAENCGCLLRLQKPGAP